MTLPSLTPEHRAAIYALASRQVDEGMARLAKGSEALAVATHAGDNAASQEAVAAMRGGLAELDAGISARRVLLEGKAPRNLALGWFKREMNLAEPALSRPQPGGKGGVRLLHVLTMVLLVGFAAAMVAMYFFKMRRASALFRRLEGDRGAPPPGSAPPLAGTSKPDGAAKPAADAAKPAAADAAKPAADAAKPALDAAKPAAADAAKPAADAAKPAPDAAKLAPGAATPTPAEQNPPPAKAPASAETSPSRTRSP